MQQVIELVRGKMMEIEAQQIRFSARDVARAVLPSIDSAAKENPMRQWLEEGKLTDIAQRVCRGKYDPLTMGADTPQDDMWKEDLQERYSVRTEGREDVYVAIDDLAEDEVEQVATMMERKANSLQRHADKLRRYYRAKVVRVVR